MDEQVLSDGWGAADPADDTLSRAGVLSLADRVTQMAAAAGRPVINDSRWVAASLADRGMFSTAGIITRPTVDWTWVATALSELAPAGVTKVLLSPFPTPDLRPDGLFLVGHPPFMVRSAEPAAAPAPVAGLEIRRVQTEEDLANFERVLIDGYPVPDMDPAAAPSLFAPDYLDSGAHLYLGFVDGEPAATAAAHVAAGVNHVEFIATLPKFRGRGIGTALTYAATLSDPSLPAVLIASDDGRGIYESIGYLAVTRWTIWLAT